MGVRGGRGGARVGRLLALILVFALPAAAGTIRVPADAPSLAAAIALAADGDTVLVADGVWKGPGNRDLLVAGKDLVIRSEHGPDLCTLDGEDLGRVFHLVDCGPGTVLEGFTIRRGLHQGGESGTGDGVQVSGGSPVVRRCVFEDCGRTYVGFWAGNTGGGIGVWEASPRIEDCVFRDNAAEEGGGVYAWQSAPVITRCVFAGNTAKALIEPGLTQPYWAGQGGAIRLLNCAGALVSECTFQGQQSVETGGALSIGRTALGFTSGRVSFCTFVGNGVIDSWLDPGPNAGTAFVVHGLGGPGVDWTLDHGIVWDNPTVLGALNGPGPGLAVTWSDVQGGYPGTGNLQLEPQFVDAAAGDLRLSPGSPCIDVGPTGPLLRKDLQDLAHAPRLLDGDLDGMPGYDMGALEFTHVTLHVEGDPTPGSTLELHVSGTPGLLALVALGLQLAAPPGFDPAFGLQLVELRSEWPAVAGPAALPFAGTLTLPAGVASLTSLYLLPLAWDPATGAGGFGAWVELRVP